MALWRLQESKIAAVGTGLPRAWVEALAAFVAMHGEKLLRTLPERKKMAEFPASRSSLLLCVVVAG